MSILTDSFFTIGGAHTVCEDYAISNELDSDFNIIGQPYAILSDGCSSAKNTSFGARLMCYASRKVSHYNSINEAVKATKLLEVDEECLYATLISLTSPGSFFNASVSGDGTVVGLKRDGTYEIYDIIFPSGAPYYQIYHYNNEYDSYVSQFGNIFTVNNEPLEIMSSPILKPVENYLLSKEQYKGIFAFSDGVSSFYREKDSTPFTVHDFLKEFLPIKNINGVFLKRWMKRTLKRLARQGVYHYDDISAIGIINNDEV